jgi:hypothetical protein
VANVEVNDISAKTVPAGTDEFEGQTTGGGASFKATLQNMFKGMINARCTVDSAGNLESGEVGVASVAKPGTGDYNVTLDVALTNVDTAQILATSRVDGSNINARPTSTTVIHIGTDVAGTPTDSDFSLLVIDEG